MQKHFADRGAGMDVDPRPMMSTLGQDAREDGNLHAIELVRNPVDGDGKESGIGRDHFIDAFCRRIAAIDRLRILAHFPVD